MKEHFLEGRRVAACRFFTGLRTFTYLIALGAEACRQPTGLAHSISIHQEITPQPVRVGEATIAVQLADAATNPVTHATIMVEADMNHPGMSPVFQAADETTPGDYHAKINFNMGGDWVLLLHIKLADGSKIERQMDVRGVRSY